MLGGNLRDSKQTPIIHLNVCWKSSSTVSMGLYMTKVLQSPSTHEISRLVCGQICLRKTSDADDATQHVVNAEHVTQESFN